MVFAFQNGVKSIQTAGYNGARTVSNLQLGCSGSPAKNFHGVCIGPLSKILAVKYFATVMLWLLSFQLGTTY